MPNQKISLTSWCNYHKLPKSSVYRRCQEMKIPVTDGLSDEAVRILEAEFNVQKTASPQPTNPVSVEVQTGAGIVVASPEIPQVYSLEALQAGGALELNDPLQVAAQFLQTADVLTSAMAQDIAAKQQRLEQTKQARNAIASKAQELGLEARLYQIQNQQIEVALTTETQQLQEDLGKLQQFVRPPADMQPSPSPSPSPSSESPSSEP